MLDVHVSLNDVEDEHDGPCAECDLSIETAEDGLSVVHVREIVQILALFLEVVDEPHLVHVAYLYEFAEES